MKTLSLTEAEKEAAIYRTKGDLKMKTLTLTESETTELIILVRRELQELDMLSHISGYEQHRQRRVDIMNSLHDKLMGEDK